MKIIWISFNPYFYQTFWKTSHTLKLKKKMFIWSFQASFTWLSSTPKNFTWMTLARASLAASASAAMARCTHLQSWEGKFDPWPLIFLLLNPFFNFIFFFICNSSLHRFTKFGNEVWSKAFYFGISIDFKLVCNVMSRPPNMELLDLKQWWLNLSNLATTKMGHHHRVFWDILTHKDLSSTNSKKGNDWNKCIICNNMNFV